MSINGLDYKDTIKHMVTGQNWKVPHKGCSDSKALSITMEVDGYLFHCFKCQENGFLRHEDSSFRDRKQREAERTAYYEAKNREGFDLPGDASVRIDQAGLAWLGKGGWSHDLIFKHGALWSDRLQRVLFRSQPIGYVARAVHADQVPKYLSKSPKRVSTYWVSEPITDRVCLTEDILSAGRVGTLYPAMAGLGTDGWNWDIICKCKQVLIWTHNDAGGEHGRQVIHKTLDWMPDIQTLDIRSNKDPKAYTTRAIEHYLQKGGAYV